MKPLLIAALLIAGTVGMGCGEDREKRPGFDPNIPIESFGTCGRCDDSWAYVEGHVTMWSETTGCFPLCEDCWASLTPRDRLPYYEELRGRDHPHWSEIEKAVLDGK